MAHRPTIETIESLRRTLQQLEQTVSPTNDPADLTELRRILLQRIAELEEQGRRIVDTRQEP